MRGFVKSCQVPITIEHFRHGNAPHRRPYHYRFKRKKFRQLEKEVMMSRRKRPLALVTVGLLISGAMLGQQVATGQVKPEDFVKVALASQREVLAPPQKRPRIPSTNRTVPTAVMPQRTLTGGNVKVGVKFTKTMLIAQGSYGVGTGRYIGAIFPDVVVQPNPTINPMPAAHWVSGLRQPVAPSVSIAAYYSGGWAQRASHRHSDATYVGCGFPDSNRQIEEATLLNAPHCPGSADRRGWAQSDSFPTARMWCLTIGYDLPKRQPKKEVEYGDESYKFPACSGRRHSDGGSDCGLLREVEPGW